MNIKYFILVFFLNIALKSFSQTADVKALSTSAEAKLKIENYEDALEEYLQLLATDSKNEIYNYNTAVCYLNTNNNKAKAVPYLEIVARNEKHNINTDYLLGRAYQYANRFDDALIFFEKYLAKAKKDDELLKEIGLEIQHCINGKEVIKYPADVSFENLGKRD